VVFWAVVPCSRVDTTISKDHAGSIFRVLACGEWKVDTDIGQV